MNGTTAALSRVQSDLIDRVLNYPVPSDVIDKYMDKYGVTENVAKEHERELKRYFAMSLANPEAAYGMFGPIDELWHTWILFTREYFQFSEAVVGHYLHHQPTTRAEKQAIRSGDAPNAYGRFLNDYPLYFGEEPSPDLWPRVQEAMEGGACSCSNCLGGCSHNSGDGAGH